MAYGNGQLLWYVAMPGQQMAYGNVCSQAAHPVLCQSKDLQSFLEASEDEWAMEMARAKHEGGANPAQKTLNSTLAKLKLFGQQTVAGGKHPDDEEDPEYLKACMQALRIH